MKYFLSYNKNPSGIVRLDDRFIVPYFSDKMKFVPKNVEERTFRMRKGEVYSLPTEECDGFTIPEKKYKCVGEINEIDGVELNSVIVKQIEGNKSSIFSLTKNDCKKIGIDFEPELQLFPKGLNWKPCDTEYAEEREIEFDSQNLSTYPTDYDSRTIRRITIKLSNFFALENRICIPLTEETVKINEFCKRLKIVSKRDIGTVGKEDYTFIPKGVVINYKIVTRCLSRANNDIVDAKGNIFIELNLDKRFVQNNVGIHPKHFENKPFEEFFDIYFDVEDKCSSNEMMRWGVKSFETAHEAYIRRTNIKFPPYYYFY